MNPVALAYLSAAVITIAISVPLVRRKVKMNHWYGVRIPQSFESEEAWYDINHHGGLLLLYWGFLVAATALVGACLQKKDWISYDWIAPVVVIGSLALVVAATYLYALGRNQK